MVSVGLKTKDIFCIFGETKILAVGCFSSLPESKRLDLGNNTRDSYHNKIELVNVTGCWSKDIYIFFFTSEFLSQIALSANKFDALFWGWGRAGGLWIRRQPFTASVIQVFQIQASFFYNKWYLQNKNDTWLLWPQTNRRGRHVDSFTSGQTLGNKK